MHPIRSAEPSFAPRRQAGARRPGALLLALLLAAQGGCSLFASPAAKPASPAPPPAPALIQNPGKAVVRVDDTDSGARVVLDRAQELVVKLPLPGGRDVDWLLIDALPGVVGVVSGPTFERAPRDQVVNEGDGIVTWHLKGLGAGSGTLGFELRKFRSRDPASQSVRYAVTVK